MENIPDMSVVWDDAQMASGADSVSSQGTPTGLSVMEAVDDARLQTQSPLSVGALPMGQQIGTIEQGIHAESSTTQRPLVQKPGVVETTHVLYEDVGLLSAMQEGQAEQSVEHVRAVRALECQKFKEEIAMLKSALKDQLEVSHEAVAAIKQVKAELQTSRDESRRWRDELRTSRLLSHS